MIQDTTRGGLVASAFVPSGNFSLHFSVDRLLTLLTLGTVKTNTQFASSIAAKEPYRIEGELIEVDGSEFEGSKLINKARIFEKTQLAEAICPKPAVLTNLNLQLGARTEIFPEISFGDVLPSSYRGYLLITHYKPFHPSSNSSSSSASECSSPLTEDLLMAPATSIRQSSSSNDDKQNSSDIRLSRNSRKIRTNRSSKREMSLPLECQIKRLLLAQGTTLTPKLYCDRAMDEPENPPLRGEITATNILALRQRNLWRPFNSSNLH